MGLRPKNTFNHLVNYEKNTRGTRIDAFNYRVQFDQKNSGNKTGFGIHKNDGLASRFY